MVGADKKLIVTQQPTAPGSNGGALVTQPKVTVEDQYGNITASTASILATAVAGSGTWTLGGTATVSAVAGVATFSGITATSAAAVTGATITFTSGILTSATSSTFNIPAPGASTGPTLAAVANQTVDNNFNIFEKTQFFLFEVIE